MNSVFEEMGGTYSDINGYLIPNLTISDSPPLGKWGRMRRRYLKEHRPALYSSMLLTGRLDQHLAEIDRSCEEQLEFIMQQLATKEGMTEALKAADQMEWVRHMNSIQNRAEEIILHELVYC
ncbi:MAG: TnpV protein [Oscillospiraceae bacterium]|nr:TnpV protein [Oscillospiraceae bacterium]